MKKTSRQYAWQKKKQSLGLCVTCGKKRVTSKYCNKHRKMENARVKARRLDRKSSSISPIK